MIKIWLRRWNAAIAWNRAYSFASKAHHIQALSVIQTVGRPKGQVLYWQLFELLELNLLARYTEALRVATVALDHLSALDGDGVNTRYLLAFTQRHAALAFAQVFPATPIPEKYAAEIASIDMSKVRRRWLRTFPLPSPAELLAR